MIVVGLLVVMALVLRRRFPSRDRDRLVPFELREGKEGERQSSVNMHGALI